MCNSKFELWVLGIEPIGIFAIRGRKVGRPSPFRLASFKSVQKWGETNQLRISLGSKARKPSIWNTYIYIRKRKRSTKNLPIKRRKK
jgi:hypothetical protein